MGNDPKFQIRRSVDHQYYFVFQAGNGQTIVTSETYTQKHNCKDAIDILKREAADADVDDETV